MWYSRGMRAEEKRVLIEENERLRAEKEELQQAKAVLQQQVEELTRQLEEALARIAELEEGKRKRPSFAKRGGEEKEKKPRRKREGKYNTSRLRMEPTRYERHALERCPECDYPLRGESIDYTREVIEIPEPQPVEVTEHQVIKRWCPRCEQWRSPQLDLRGQVIGQGRIGVRVASLVSYLRMTMRLPVRQVQSYLETIHGLRVSAGEIVELCHDVREALQWQADEMKGEMRGHQVVHGDETGWRENGRHGYVWTFVTDGAEAVRYFEFSFSRSHLVAKRILGSEFRGWLVTDFYGAYNLIPGSHQRCWSHLLRDLHALKEAHAGEEEVVGWAQEVRKLYDEGQAWLKEHEGATEEERRQCYGDLYQRVCHLGEKYAQEAEHPCRVLAKRLLRHQDELFQFVWVPGLPADNNLAERSLRPLVIMRKISGGSRSSKGTRTRMTLATLFHTWAARHLNPFQECLSALQHPGVKRTEAPP